MQPTVTAVLVARNGAQYLPRTLAAIAAQSRRPDALVLVDVDSSDDSAALLAEFAAGSAVPAVSASTHGRRSFGAAIAHGLSTGAPRASEQEWLWLLAHDSAPEPGALQALLGAVEVAPSVVIAGPKLMRWDEPGVIADFGQSVTGFGRTVHLVTDELDQAQFDRRSDVLAVAGAGLLVRRTVWASLGGFDPGLPTADAGLDLGIRARLAGHRVIGVPAARVASAGPAELFGRRSLSAGARNRIRRSAQLHRRLVYSPALALPLHWLSLLPLGLLRGLWHLLAKRPGAVAGELLAALGAAVDGSVPSARRTLRRSRSAGWAAVRPLRATRAEVHELRAHDHSGPEEQVAPARLGFFTAGGAWAVLLAGVLGAVVFGGWLGQRALSGGGLLPLSSTVAELWSNAGWGWHDIGPGFTGPADPFAAVLAVLGSLTFWAPSTAIVLLHVAALPLAALGAWFAAARLCRQPWAPALAALAWALAPPFLVSLTEGRLGAVLVHLLLPPLLLAVLGAARSWAAAAAGSIAFAVVAASAPSVVPALLAGIVAWMLVRPAAIHRLLLMLVPTAVLFAPLVLTQVLRGTPLALLADPGLPVPGAAPAGVQLVLGDPDGGLLGWPGFLAGFGIAPAAAGAVVPALLAPLIVLALAAPFLPGARRSLPALVLALLGLATATAAGHLQLATAGAQPVPLWAGAGLSLYLLGLLGAAAVTLELLRGVAAAPALLSIAAIAALALPLLGSVLSGSSAVQSGTGRMLPAFATAEAADRPQLGTLVLEAQADGIASVLHRGVGTTLDEQSTLEATRSERTEADDRLAVIAGNLASHSGMDLAAELDQWQIAFVVLAPAESEQAAAIVTRAGQALDSNRLLTPVGQTDFGFLWHYAALGEAAAPTGLSATETELGRGILIAQGIVFGLALLLAVPSRRRRRLRAAKPDAAAETEAADA